MSYSLLVLLSYCSLSIHCIWFGITRHCGLNSQWLCHHIHEPMFSSTRLLSHVTILKLAIVALNIILFLIVSCCHCCYCCYAWPPSQPFLICHCVCSWIFDIVSVSFFIFFNMFSDSLKAYSSWALSYKSTDIITLKIYRELALKVESNAVIWNEW